MTASSTHAAIRAVWKIERARLIAGLARMVRDVGVAEDLAQDALVVALESWPEAGVPDRPGAWLMAVAKRKGLDRLRQTGQKPAESGRFDGHAQDLDMGSAGAGRRPPIHIGRLCFSLAGGLGRQRPL